MEMEGVVCSPLSRLQQQQPHHQHHQQQQQQPGDDTVIGSSPPPPGVGAGGTGVSSSTPLVTGTSLASWVTAPHPPATDPTTLTGLLPPQVLFFSLDTFWGKVISYKIFSFFIFLNLKFFWFDMKLLLYKYVKESNTRFDFFMFKKYIVQNYNMIDEYFKYKTKWF